MNVTVPFATLLRIGDEPGILHGYGLIHPEVARRIAAEATWRRVLTDPATGAVLDYGQAHCMIDIITTRPITGSSSSSPRRASS